MFPRHKHIKWTVCSKADAIFPIVGAASIAAKVTRDRWLESWKYAEVGLDECLARECFDESGDDFDDPSREEGPPTKKTRTAKRSPKKRQHLPMTSSLFWTKGSGYPSDPDTKKYLLRVLDPVFGWPGIVRFSWQTAKTLMEDKLVPIDSKRARAIILTLDSAPKSVLSADTPFGTKNGSGWRCHSIRWNDEAPQITNFFQKAAMSGKANGLTSNVQGFHKRSRAGLAKELCVVAVGPDSF